MMSTKSPTRAVMALLVLVLAYLWHAPPVAAQSANNTNCDQTTVTSTDATNGITARNIDATKNLIEHLDQCDGALVSGSPWASGAVCGETNPCLGTDSDASTVVNAIWHSYIGPKVLKNASSILTLNQRMREEGDVGRYSGAAPLCIVDVDEGLNPTVMRPGLDAEKIDYFTCTPSEREIAKRGRYSGTYS